MSGLTVQQLRDALNGVDPDMPVIIKYDEGDLTIILDVGAATKQGGTFRVYGDPETKRVVGLVRVDDPIITADVYVPPEERGNFPDLTLDGPSIRIPLGTAIEVGVDTVTVSLDPVLPDEEIGEHRFSQDPRALQKCLDCGVSLEDAMHRRCGA